MYILLFPKLKCSSAIFTSALHVIVLFIFLIIAETQVSKVDYNAVHDENTYVTESRAINDYILQPRYKPF